MVNNPELLSGMGVVAQLRDNSDYPHSGLYKTFNTYAHGSYATSGFNITQSQVGGYTRFTLTDGDIFRNGGYVAISPTIKYSTLTAANAPHATYTYYLLLVVDSANLYQLRGTSATLAVTNAKVADLTDGDIPIAVIQITAATLNTDISRNIQYVTVKQRAKSFSYGVETSSVFEHLLTLGELSGDTTLATLKQDKDLIFTVNDGGITTELMRLNGSDSSVVLPSSKRMVFGASTEYITGNTSALYAYSSAAIELSANGGSIKFNQGGLYPLEFNHTGTGDWAIYNASINTDITLQVNDGGVKTQAIKIKTNATDILGVALPPSVSIGANEPQAPLHINADKAEVIVDTLNTGATQSSIIQLKRSTQNLPTCSIGDINFTQFAYTSSTQFAYANILGASLSYGTSNSENQRGQLQLSAIGFTGASLTPAIIQLNASNAATMGSIIINSANGAAPTYIKSAGNDKALTVVGGKTGVNTSSPDIQLEVNADDAPQLRLTYNDSNGSATVKTDLYHQATGELLISPSGFAMRVDGTIGGRALTEVSATNPALSSGESGKVVFMTNGGAIACTLPNLDLEIGIQFVIVQKGAGAVTITAGTNSTTGTAQTINGAATKATTALDDAITVIYAAVNTWYAIG
tara:strand:- start:23981 stop:25888 length:1908 start_codon:yes stop_codon:yes gene_type:complete